MINSANAKLLLALIMCALVALVVIATPPVGAQTPSAGITVSDMNLTVLAQGTGTFTVQLATQPTADVEVSLTSRNTDTPQCPNLP